MFVPFHYLTGRRIATKVHQSFVQMCHQLFTEWPFVFNRLTILFPIFWSSVSFLPPPVVGELNKGGACVLDDSQNTRRTIVYHRCPNSRRNSVFIHKVHLKRIKEAVERKKSESQHAGEQREIMERQQRKLEDAQAHLSVYNKETQQRLHNVQREREAHEAFLRE